MKKIFPKKLVLGIIISLAVCGTYETSLAAGAAPVLVTNFDVVNDALGELFLKSFIKSDFKINNIDAYKQLLTEQLFINSWDKLPEKQNLVNEQQKTSSFTAIGLAMADDNTKQYNLCDLALIPAAEDQASTTAPCIDPSSIRSTFTKMLKNIYSPSPSSDNTASTGNNASFNADSFLGPLQYEEKKEDKQQYEKNYLRYISNLATPPSVISVSKDSFTIPYIPKDQTGDSFSINWSKTKHNPAYVQDNILYTPEYRKYRLDYRTQIAARSLFINNILQTYLKRLPMSSADNTKTSLAKVEYDEAYRRTNKNYQTAILVATPIEVEREIALTLAEIRRELYKVQQNQERQLVTQSLMGLQSLDQNKIQSQQDAKRIGKLIYCLAYGLGKDHEITDLNGCKAELDKADVDTSAATNATVTKSY